MVDFKKGLRSASSAEPLVTTSIDEIVAELEPVGIRIVTRKASGVDYLHLVTDDDKFLTIKIGPKVVLEQTTHAKKINELIKNYTIYTGETDNGIWVTFGPTPGELEPTETLDFAKVMKAGKIKLASV